MQLNTRHFSRKTQKKLVSKCQSCSFTCSTMKMHADHWLSSSAVLLGSLKKVSKERKEGRKNDGISFKAKGGGLLFDVLSVRVGSVR